MEATLEKKPKKKLKVKKETYTNPKQDHLVLAKRVDRTEELSTEQIRQDILNIEDERRKSLPSVTSISIEDPSEFEVKILPNSKECGETVEVTCDVCVPKEERESCNTVVNSDVNENQKYQFAENLQAVSLSQHAHNLSVEDLKSKQIYPDLKSIEKCYHTDNIVSSLLFVKTYSIQYMEKVWCKASQEFQEFMKVATGLENHPLTEMIWQYRDAKKSHKQIDSRIRYLRSNFKRKIDSLWITVEKKCTSVGKCADGVTVRVSRNYSVKELDLEKFGEIKSMIKELEESFVSAAFYSYQVVLMKLKIEHYIHESIKNSEIRKNSMNHGNYTEENEILKKCVSILFDSLRQKSSDKSYLSSCQKWLRTLVIPILQNDDFKNNIFVINHIIRCPNGIYNWASEFIQIPFSDHSKTEEEKNVDCACIHNLLLVLFLVLQTAPERDAFLKNLRDLSPELSDRNFILLDSEGEEEETFEMSKKWSEEDVISILKQVPLASLYKHIVFNANGGTSNEKRILKMIAFSTTLVDILLLGLNTYISENFYKVFELIGHMIRHIVSYVSFYCKNIFLNFTDKPEHQAVYDQFLFHVVFKIHKYEKVGIWKVLPYFPYNLVSLKMLWNILFIFYCPDKSENDIYSEKDVERKIKDEAMDCVIIENIKKVSQKSIVHLLNTFREISLSCVSEDISSFLCLIIFRITIESSFQGSLSNESIVILTSIVKKCPNFTSLLIQEIKLNDESISEYTQKLFRSMDILEWIPENNDISILSEWLLFNPLSSGFSHLSRLILKKINWDFKNDTLFLPLTFHKRVAILVAEAYITFDMQGNEGILPRGIKQVLEFARIKSVKEEQSFTNWAWNLLFALKLHPLDFKNPPWIQIYEGSVASIADPFIAETDAISLKSLQTATEIDHPCYSYLSLVMTDIGMSVKKLVEKGLSCFCNLVNSQQYMAAINSLYYILPFFVKNAELLLAKEEFMTSLSYLITADTTTISMASEPVYGAVIKEISAMIKHQLEEVEKLAAEYSVPLIKLLIKILLNMLSSQDKGITSYLKSGKQVYYLLDVIAQIAFLHPYVRDSVIEFLPTLCKPNLGTLDGNSQTSFWSRFFSNSPSFFPILNKCVIPEFPWLAFFILFTETKQKNVHVLWIRVQEEITKPDISAISAFKNASSSQKISPTYDILPIYRWALQIIETPISHPILPLFLQQFFLYYFYQLEKPSPQGYKSNGMLYFKNAAQQPLFRKLKNHIIQAGKYYKAQFEKSAMINFQDQDPVPCAPLEQSIEVQLTEECIQHNLMKLFHAFSEWITDESLHKTNLCLSALSPKYYLEYLNRVLNGNQVLWVEFISTSHLKEKLEYKINGWISKRGYDTPIHNIEVVKNPEELQFDELLSRHEETYYRVKSIKNCEVPCAAVVENNTSQSVITIMQMFQKNHLIIGEKAKLFSEYIKKIKQLNFNYVNWIPQEYKTRGKTEKIYRECLKNCSGAAVFVLQIEESLRNVRIVERIHLNRDEYLIVQDQISKHPVNDLCIAALEMEEYIKILSNSTEIHKNKKLISNLFYKQMKTIDDILPSVTEYPPSRHFYSTIIEALGKFVEMDGSALLDLAKSILDHSNAGPLALSLFNPNCSSIPIFLKFYEMITVTSKNSSQSILLALMSKIDLQSWLNNMMPEFQDRQSLFHFICDGILECGNKPTCELLPYFEVLKKHFRIVLLFVFPELMIDTVKFLIKGMESKKLSTDMLYEVIHCLGCPDFTEKCEDIQEILKKYATNLQLSADQQRHIFVVHLNLNQVKEILSYLYHHFMTKRLSCVLYDNVKEYIRPFGMLLALIIHSLIIFELEKAVKEIHRKIVDLEDFWDTFHLPFFPWLHPTANETGFSFPWSFESENNARYMFQIFITCFNCFHEELLKNKIEGLLSYMWNRYVTIYVLPGFRHYSVSVCHEGLLQLPWNQFYPSACDIEGMCKVLQGASNENKSFLSKISMKIPWIDVLKYISSNKAPCYIAKVLKTVGELLIISEFDHETKNCLLPLIFKERLHLPWHFLSADDVEHLLNLYFYKADEIFKIKDSDSTILDFLKMVSSMIPSSNIDDNANQKRITYLKKYKEAVINNVSNQSSTDGVIKIKTVIPFVFEDIETVISSDVKTDEQIQTALPLVEETLSLINELPEELVSPALTSLNSYIKENPKRLLLLPCLKVSCYYLKSVKLSVPVIETCVSTRFSKHYSDGSSFNTWLIISSCFKLPSCSLEEFSDECIKTESFLTLYCYLLHKLPIHNSIDSKKWFLQQTVLWTRDIKLSQHSESKFLLLLDKILEISIDLVREETEVVIRHLNSLCWKLSIFAEDKSQDGFWGALGFGQTSSLSVNFRFLCRIMAAYIGHQITGNSVRVDPHDPVKQSSSPDAEKALDNLKLLHQKKIYAAVQSHIEYAVKCINDANYTLTQSRELLKYFAISLFSDASFLCALETTFPSFAVNFT